MQIPYNQDAEQAFIGALLVDKDAIYIGMEYCKPKYFYLEKHQKIMAAIIEVNKRNQPIDLITITNELSSRGELNDVGGPYYIVECTNRVASSANIEAHGLIIHEKYTGREAIRICLETIEKINAGKIKEALIDNDLEMVRLRGEIGEAEPSNADTATELLRELDRAIENPGQQGMDIFGLPSLDRITSGLREGDVCVIAGRPGMGKSSLANNAYEKAQKDRSCIAIWSMEMPRKITMRRCAAAMANLPYKRIEQGHLNDAEIAAYSKVLDELASSPVILKTKYVTVSEFRAQCVLLKRKHKVKTILLDRIELLVKTDPKMSDTAHISEVTPQLRRIANELQIPIIVISQLNRAVETRGGAHRPQLSDLRNSGTMEQDATIVNFIYRPEYYDILEDDEGNSLKGVAELIVAKNTNGETGTAKVKFLGDKAIFRELPIDDDFPDIMGNDSPIVPASEANRNKDEDIPF